MKLIKSIFLISLIFVISLLGISETASAKKTSTTIKMNSNFAYGGKAYLTTSENSSKVFATYKAAYESYVYVRLTLQRYKGGKWKDLSTKSGYASEDFHNKKNLNVTFNNISNVTKKPTRIKIRLYSGWDPKGKIMQTAYSKKWTR